MAKTIMIQGTTSNAGKSLVAAALCRIFMQDGYKVAPFKSQNMALNSFITRDGLEMGRAQVMQAEAAGIEPDVCMNPILLKPTSDKGSQVIVNGEVLGDMTAKEYYASKEKLIPHIKRAYAQLEEQFDIIVIEGAGSPAEINLKDNDIVNMGMARMVKSPVLIVGDIDRGGVFAALAGTMLLLTEEEKALVKGLIINKFRGDVSILEPGLRSIEQITSVPVVGVVPYLKVDIDDEDSLSSRIENKKCKDLIDIAVIRLPRISNFTDLNALEYIDGVSVRYIDSIKIWGSPDLIVLPGTKNTIGDLKWLRESGLESAILKHAASKKPVFGICGGYQMLGEYISDKAGVEGNEQIAGIGLLPGRTEFYKEKTRLRVSGKLPQVGGVFGALSGTAYEGYEIHMGQTLPSAPLVQSENVYGSYIHGIFDSEPVIKAVTGALFRAKGIKDADVQSFDLVRYKQDQYDILANSVRDALDIPYIYSIMEDANAAR